jgi:hypothetical protein
MRLNDMSMGMEDTEFTPEQFQEMTMQMGEHIVEQLDLSNGRTAVAIAQLLYLSKLGVDYVAIQMEVAGQQTLKLDNLDLIESTLGINPELN